MARITVADKPRLLVTGATGLLGWALVQEALGRYRTWGLARHVGTVSLPCQTQSVDLVDGPATAKAIGDIKPQVVIHAAALASVDQCERNPDMATLVNVEATQNLLQALHGQPCRFVLISTDSVFDGDRGNYAEHDPTVPLHAYARTKLQAEEAVRRARPDALIVRTVFYGWNLVARESLAEWIVNRLRDGREVPGFVDARFSPLLTTHLAQVLFELIRADISGILHVAGSESCSKFEFARHLAVLLGYPPARVVPTTIRDVYLSAPRPLNTSLSVNRATAILGRPLPGLLEGLRDFVALESAMKGVKMVDSANVK